MALYIADGNVYLKDENGVFGVDVTAKDKVVRTSELESITITPKGKTDLPNGAHPVTTDELVRKLNLSESNPCLFKGKTKKKEKAEEE